jgi:hypothetical protein
MSRGQTVTAIAKRTTLSVRKPHTRSSENLKRMTSRDRKWVKSGFEHGKTCFRKNFAIYGPISTISSSPDTSNLRARDQSLGHVTHADANAPLDSEHAECGGVRKTDSVIVFLCTGTLRRRKNFFRADARTKAFVPRP